MGTAISDCLGRRLLDDVVGATPQPLAPPPQHHEDVVCLAELSWKEVSDAGGALVGGTESDL